MYHYSSAVDTLRAADYRFDMAEILTPALVIYPEIVRQNIRATIAALGGDPARWRPHVKTGKLLATMKLLVEAGVRTAKCATTLELRTACEAGFRDVLVSYPHTGRNARRVAEIADEFPAVRVAALAEAEEQVASSAGTRVDLFIDVNPGMDRTGIECGRREAIRDLALRIRSAGVTFRGLHFYDGNSTEQEIGERVRRAQERYAELMDLASFLENAGVKVSEIVTAGTPALPAAIGYESLWKGPFRHQVSPGTVVYNDFSTLRQLPEAYGLKPAALVVSRVVSRPAAAIVTCDAGHKAVSVDSGVPNCVVLEHPELEAQKPSEEHLPFKVMNGAVPIELGEMLYLVPRHVCPTVNNFDRALLVSGGRVESVEPVSARGREAPLAKSERKK